MNTKSITFLLITLIFTLILSTFTTAALNEGLIACYNLDATGNVIDSKGIYPGGTVTGATHLTVGQKIGTGAYSFDGNNDYVELGNFTNGINMSNKYTISFWMKKDTIAAVNRRAFSSCDQFTHKGSACFAVSNGADTNYYHITNHDGTEAIHTPGISPFSAGVWYNVVMIYDGTKQQVWIDGISSANNTVAMTNIEPLNGACNNIIGGYVQDQTGTCTYSQFFDGDLDEIKIWNTTITHSQILEEYNAGTGTSCALAINGTPLIQQTYVTTVTDSTFFTHGDVFNITTVSGAQTSTYVDADNTTAINISNGTNTITFNKKGWFPHVSTFIYDNETNNNITINNLVNTYLTFIGNTTATDYSSSISCTFNSTSQTKINNNYYTTTTGSTLLTCAEGAGFPGYTNTFTKSHESSYNNTFSIPEYTLQLFFSQNTSGTITWSGNGSLPGGGIRNFSYMNHTYSTVNFCDNINACYVEVEFNDNGIGKQIYEFYNDYSGQEQANLYVTNNLESFIYFKVVGPGNDPIDEVQLQLWRLDDGNGEQNYSMIGQRYTLPDGTQSFYLAGDDYAQLIVSKTGYGLQAIKVDIDEFQNVTYASPYIIELQPFATIYGYDTLSFCYGTTFGNETEFEKIGFWAKTTLDYIEFNTSYYSPLTLVSPESQILNKDLTRNTHFNNSDFTIHMWNSAGQEINNCTYTYLTSGKQDLTLGLDQLTGINTNFSKLILFIIIIFVSIIIGATIGVERGTAGFTTFMVLAFCISFINWQFWPISLLVSIYFISDWTFKTTQA